MVLLEDIARESTVYIQGCGLVVHGSAGLFERFGASHFRQRHRALYRNSKTTCAESAWDQNWISAPLQSIRWRTCRQTGCVWFETSPRPCLPRRSWATETNMYALLPIMIGNADIGGSGQMPNVRLLPDSPHNGPHGSWPRKYEIGCN
jgi:hypothetical protein